MHAGVTSDRFLRHTYEACTCVMHLPSPPAWSAVDAALMRVTADVAVAIQCAGYACVRVMPGYGGAGCAATCGGQGGVTG